MDCYSCRWRVPCKGSAHSECHHPRTKEGWGNPTARLFAIFASVGRCDATIYNDGIVTLSEHGVKNGWANYPYNFDPTWIKTCEGYEPKSKEGEAPKPCFNLKTCEDCEKKYECWTKERKDN